MNAEPLVSVVLAVLDDEPMLQARLAELAPAGDRIEVIAVDGAVGESAAMARLRAAFPAVHWLRSAAGRGRQMNAGAAEARGRWLLFLHADTRLDEGWMDEIDRLEGGAGGAAWGAFRFALDSSDWRARLIEWGVARRVRWLWLPFGDQALFVRRPVFERLGGYADLPLMEDVELVRRLARDGHPHWVPLQARTSARRWIRDGWVRRSATNVGLQLLYFAGVPPAWLARRYAPKPGRTPSSGGPGPGAGSASRGESL